MADVSTGRTPIGSGGEEIRKVINVRRKRLELTQARMAIEENEIRRMELDATIASQQERVETLTAELEELVESSTVNGSDN